MKCFHCQKPLVKNLSKMKEFILPKTCPWCRKIQAPRQSLRSFKPKKK